jgi:hypothetical protein
MAAGMLCAYLIVGLLMSVKEMSEINEMLKLDISSIRQSERTVREVYERWTPVFTKKALDVLTVVFYTLFWMPGLLSVCFDVLKARMNKSE